MMKKCKVCGMKIDNGYLVCGSCGSALNSLESVTYCMDCNFLSEELGECMRTHQFVLPKDYCSKAQPKARKNG